MSTGTLSETENKPQTQNLRTNIVKRERATTTSTYNLPTDSLYGLQFPSIDGDMIQLSKFAGRASVVINVASE